MFTVSTPAVSRDVIGIGDLKEALGITGSADDIAIQSRIDRLGDLMAGECAVPGDGVAIRTLIQETITETFRLQSASDQLVLARRPLVSVTSVVVNGTTLSGSDYEAERGAGLMYRLSSDARQAWPAGKIVVVYVAGWTAAALQTAAVAIYREMFLGEARDPLARSESVDGVSKVDYWVGGLDSNNGSALSNQAAATLDPYRYHAV